MKKKLPPESKYEKLIHENVKMVWIMNQIDEEAKKAQEKQGVYAKGLVFKLPSKRILEGVTLHHYKNGKENPITVTFDPPLECKAGVRYTINNFDLDNRTCTIEEEDEKVVHSTHSPKVW